MTSNKQTEKKMHVIHHLTNVSDPLIYPYAGLQRIIAKGCADWLFQGLRELGMSSGDAAVFLEDVAEEIREQARRMQKDGDQ